MRDRNQRGASEWRAIVALAVTMAGCAEPEPPLVAWNPELADGDESTGGAVDPSTSGHRPDDSADGTTSDGRVCTPGEVIACACPMEGSGEQVCEPDGSGFGPCECDDNGGTTSDDGAGSDDSGSTGGGGMLEEVCYPGPANDFTLCLPLRYFEPMPEGYEYPEPYMGNDNYRAPVALIDLEQIDPATMLAPNFRLDEIAQLYKGRYAVVQPHAIVSLQALRDQVGAIAVNSGYRSPAYNAGLPGSATYSRHMYGDAYDLDPLEVSLSTLEAACTGQGGMLVEYTSHVHCDFRFDPVDEEFFGPPSAAGLPGRPGFEATLVPDADGGWTAPARGFDEGTPQRRWIARDAAGQVLATAVAERFVPPPGTATVAVRVGAQVERSADLSP
ncbi:MAG: D-Ala-D-Ala carboxypeptidase family metallohydrolase [Myxococcota bacterium]